MTSKSMTLAALLLSSAVPAFADGELNIYSSRHYDTDELLYSEFEEATGITINRIEGKADEMEWLPPSPNGIVMCQEGGLNATS